MYILRQTNQCGLVVSGLFRFKENLWADFRTMQFIETVCILVSDLDFSLDIYCYITCLCSLATSVDIYHCQNALSASEIITAYVWGNNMDLSNLRDM